MRRSLAWLLILLGVAAIVGVAVLVPRARRNVERDRRERVESVGPYSRSTLSAADKAKVKAGWTFDTKTRHWVDENLNQLPDGAKP